MVKLLQKDIVIIGTGGFAKEVLFLLEENNKIKNEWNILGFIDHGVAVGTNVIYDYNVIGDDTWLQNYPSELNVVCAVANAIIKKKIIAKFSEYAHLLFPVIVSHKVIYSDLVTIGRGSIICAGSILTVNITIGEFVIINLDTTIGHDTVIGDFVTIYPGVRVSGNVRIGTLSEVGTGTQIIQGVSIGEHAILGAGSVVIREIPAECTAVGNPARVIK